MAQVIQLTLLLWSLLSLTLPLIPAASVQTGGPLIADVTSVGRRGKGRDDSSHPQEECQLELSGRKAAQTIAPSH